MNVFYPIYFSSTQLDPYPEYLDITAIFSYITSKIGGFGSYLEVIQ